MANPSELAIPTPTLLEAPEPNGQARPDLDSLFQEFARLVGSGEGPPPRLREWVDLAEAWRITHALRECRGNRSAAARSLGIGRRTLYSKMEKLGIAEGWTWGRT